jgi:hypothetical protein
MSDLNFIIVALFNVRCRSEVKAAQNKDFIAKECIVVMGFPEKETCREM